MTKNFNLWLISVVLQLIVVGVAGFFGFFDLLVKNDSTYIGFFIIASWFVSLFFIGKTAYEGQKAKEWHWYVTEKFLSLGMLGTVIGLIIVFGDFYTLDISNVEQTRQIVGAMASGVSTALYTTLVGLVFSIFTKIQLVLIDHE